jgi:zinc protease
MAAAVVIVAVVFCVPAGLAGDLPELEFEKYELSNGLDVILHVDHSIPIVSVNVWYHTGSKNEEKGRTGFAHLFEHMMFQGSEHHPDKHGESVSKYGGSRNGSTSEDRTNYWENVPSNYLEKMLWLEADRMGYLLPAVTEERFEIQRNVVMNEKRQNWIDPPYARVGEYSFKLMYPSDHPYSWSVIGHMEDLQAATLEDIHSFFKKYYAPNNASLCIAGDFDPEQAKEWVEKYFGPIPPGPTVDRLEHWVPVLSEEKRASVEDNVRLPRLYMAWHTPPYYAPGDAEFDLLASVLVGGKSSRLYKELVYDKQIAQDVSAYQSSREIGSTFHIRVTAKEGHTLEEIELEVDLILDEVLTGGITADEMERAKTNWEAGFVRSLQNVGGFGGRADVLNKYNTYLDDPGRLLWDRNRYTSATSQGVLSYAREYLKPDARLVLYCVPQGQLKVAEVETDMFAEPGTQAEPDFTPPTIQTATLSNGMDVFLVEDHKLPLVQLDFTIKTGWAADPVDRPSAGSLTSDLLNEGTETRTALEISEEAQRLGLVFGTSSSFDNATVSTNVLTKNIDPALDLVADVMMNPTFPQEELDRIKKNYQGRLKQESVRPITVAVKAFLKELYGEDHPYGQSYTGTGTEESIEAITRDDIVAYYSANYVPNNTAAILVGDITLEEAKAKLEKAFKGWPQRDITASSVAPVTPVSSTKVCMIDKPGSAQSTIIIGNLMGPRSDPAFLPTTVVSQVLGGGSGGRLYKNLREARGFTYGAYTFMLSRRGQGTFACYAQVQTEVTDSALVEFVKEIRGIVGGIPVSDEELSDSKGKLTKGYPQDFQTVGGIADELSTLATFNLPLDEWNGYVNRVNAVDVAKALSTARQNVHPEGLLIVIVGDRAKIEDKVRALDLGEVYYADAQ